ncbi:Brix-domain-containing protein [Auriscalpium vulgare]|uniref:Brix-domain-containing protein n=1 Tax=Auriscalpium vulgare TaxID=40419 RepID=A0ACB8RSK2_9AGAM|nr:Brix-domain-containing protein [Auriscalpium vulgare]
MPSQRFEPSSIKNRIKREDVSRKVKRAKGQAKLRRRLELAKLEADDPKAKQKRLSENVPRTLDNSREFDPSILTADPSSGPSTHQQPSTESAADIATDPFASYFTPAESVDPSAPQKVLITTSSKATRITYEFCDELVGVFPGAEFHKRPKSRGFEMGRIASWAAGRGYTNMIVVNENHKAPNAITMVHLPNGPTAYFKLTSIELTKNIFKHARATPHNPELVLNNFVTRLGHTVGRMFQTFFPPLPEFQGRQVVTLHNQRDFLFFRRHRYAFRSTEKVALQEIGPRFTLKLRSLKKGLPAVKDYAEAPQALRFDDFEDASEEPAAVSENVDVPAFIETTTHSTNTHASAAEEYEWQWKPELETTRRTFFL